MGFSRPEYWSELPCLPPGDLPSSKGFNSCLPHCTLTLYHMSYQGTSMEKHTSINHTHQSHPSSLSMISSLYFLKKKENLKWVQNEYRWFSQYTSDTFPTPFWQQYLGTQVYQIFPNIQLNFQKKIRIFHKKIFRTFLFWTQSLTVYSIFK